MFIVFTKTKTIELYRYTSDNHIWSTEASGEVARFSSNGNVGIGTDAPSGKLDVQNGANRAIKFEVDGTSGDNHIKSYQGNGENVRNLRITGQEIAIDTNSSGESQGVNRIKVLTNGNVGIGIDAPSRKLEVNGTFQSGQAFMLADTASAGALHVGQTGVSGYPFVVLGDGTCRSPHFDLETLPSLSTAP